MRKAAPGRAIMAVLALLLAALWPAAGPATTPKRPPGVVQTENVRAEIVAERDAVGPGERMLIGLHQVIRKGWHTYWLNPGDSGLPTRLHWTLRDDASVGPTIWPAPQRFTIGPLVNYGYAGETVLLAELAVPESARPGEAVTILLHAEWLVCEEICIPEEAELSLTLPVTEATGAVTPAAAAIARARDEVPRPSPWPASFAARGERIVLQVQASGLDARTVHDAYFFPFAADALDHAAPQRAVATADGLALELTPAASRRGRPLATLDGVLAIAAADAGSRPRAYALAAASAPIAATTIAALDASPVPLWRIMLFALLGGLLLNLMPCVLPVLSMKALAFLGHAHREAGARRREGLAYTAGVVGSFLVIAALLIALRAGGAELGWGFQFQSPVFVAAMACVILAVGLSLSGVFHLSGAGLATLTDGIARRRDGLGAFFTGFLAVVVATPCTAPFMGAALGLALVAPAPILVATLATMGLGLALPFLVLSLAPGAARWLPRPGTWMDRLKQVLAFPMYATAGWLVWVLSQQVAADGLALALAALLAVAFVAWLYGALSPSRPRLAGIVTLAGLLVVAVALARLDDAPALRRGAGDAASAIAEAEPYDAARLAALRAEGRPVFVNMTAAWCITCIVNERTTLSSAAVRRSFAEHRVAYLVGDWTQRDPIITAFLRSFGRSGVPLYVAYPAGGGAPVVLPQLLTESSVTAALFRR